MKITPASDESGDPTVQFSILHNPHGDDFNPPYEEVVVLTVQASMVDLRAAAASTELIPSSGDDHKASALEIRGNSTDDRRGGEITEPVWRHSLFKRRRPAASSPEPIHRPQGEWYV